MNYVLISRAQLGEDPNEKKEIKEELTKSRKQMEESRLRLTKLHNDGSELVSNIRVAGDAREASRRIEEEDQRRQRQVLQSHFIYKFLSRFEKTKMRIDG